MGNIFGRKIIFSSGSCWNPLSDMLLSMSIISKVKVGVGVSIAGFHNVYGCVHVFLGSWLVAVIVLLPVSH